MGLGYGVSLLLVVFLRDVARLNSLVADCPDLAEMVDRVPSVRSPRGV